ncbi:HupE/UreJ family protein [Marivirga arenosa]|jgi:hydrogenase/urease accessory protein HupE|uniref:HupE/UreJ family protein n=1 Tax=Marivirga arenosa TaxID=3059076 RepID=A0AA52EZ82_9BACT|nr:HupE/UreJ family protein [Marivirga sp. BKB1-2]WNB18247.1 HupE/UreJ family protein [Marivirga sp. BKB1-2]
MSTFKAYFLEGFHHILDVNGYDHILFVLALSAIYLMKDWRKVLILITAFTIGHSITLALSTLNIVAIKAELIEFLIPVTIFITAFANLFKKERSLKSSSSMQLNYIFALLFGLIHGLGFSNYLKAILGKNSSIVMELLAFNIGLEIGQIIVVLSFLLISFIFIDILGTKRRDWVLIISSAIGGIAITIMMETKFW